MRLVVKQNDRTINEFRFTKGPIYIGRHTNSQVFLPGRAVSRQHAVIFKTYEGKWMVEDLDSANKTYINDQPIHKVEIKTGDSMRITDFTIEIDLAEDEDAEKPIYLEDTLVTSSHSPQVIVRKIGTEHAPDIKMPAKRAKDFIQATELICKSDSLDEMRRTILSATARQFAAFHVWCALRGEPSGPMTCYGGKQRDGKGVELNEIKLSEKINEAIDKGQFLLLPQLPTQREQKIRSAMIAPIMGSAGCFGVIYIDNATDHEHYTISDLDYLMLLAIHTATVLKNF